MEDFSEQQQFFMRRAIEIGEKGRISAPPNPWVGCVLVKDRKIIGEGYHVCPGSPHAEDMAIREAITNVEGSQVYVTLEPCSHYGTRPPCVNLLIKHKISEVFIALVDPDSRVSGKGVEALKRSGIRVHIGLEEKAAKESLRPYLHQRSLRSPWILLKSAASIDGQIADSNNQSQWITCQKARQDVGLLRASSQAVIVGSRTVIIDNPQLTARFPSGEMYSRQPLRVVLDSSGRIPKNSQIFHLKGDVLYVTTQRCPLSQIRDLEALGVEVLIVDSSHLGVNLHQLIQHLASKNILQVLVEGGATVHTEFLRERLAHALVVYFGPKILGNQKKPIFGDIGCLLSSAQTLVPISSEIIGDSLKVFWEIAPLNS
ncbi:bifunctional diaminohydroxyphosphoribosylaminopyrimidine deaminase/5-amino-6-(5-phosphoribosylamino)uracil reductase RibD [Chlamydia sp. 17-3921]|uniref:bifunctional diaminohydroxyphosphoribosylaminopyrimidine deaminase/5-amino-6-(5-phosphoribosylamino)uracil reductase RibD n=1 Tax=Chlamydia sp. 17-3921 TaxID=2675798 RepID=UPI0019185809|nr:bifunctional diaminohydroxyphosphoribosylaminopyrimidine deaminase/5-amino-6-(5-phosphoribosylamino)uracil reductase RibD [Chlamydia sp. 17-3921]